MGGSPKQPDFLSSYRSQKQYNKKPKTFKSFGEDLGGNPAVASREPEVPRERLASLPFPQEMTFACSLSQGSRVHYLDAVLDTGCGSGFVVGGACGFSVIPACYPVELADGSTVRVVELVEVELTVGRRTELVLLKVLPSSAAREPYVLFGRELKARFQLETQGCRVIMDGEVLHDAISFLSDSWSGDPGEGEKLTELPPVERDTQESVSLPIGKLEKEAVERVIEMELQIRRELDFCAGATMVLRRLDGSDRRDTGNQGFTFELTLPPAAKPVSSAAANRLYSASVYRKLNEEDRKEFDDLVDQYVQRGWWAPADYEECATRCGYAANVFPVVAKGKKTRLVSDFRMLNQFYPASTRTPRIHHPLMLLRCLAGDNLIVADCRSAFYRVRLADPVWLHVGGRNFLCHRLAFGLSMGPEGLRASLGALWNLWKQDLARGPGYGALFVDDFFVTQGRDVPTLFYMLERCGFEVPVEKFQNDLAVTRLLGSTLRREHELMALECDDVTISELVERVRKNPTKKEFFALAGRVGYDPSHLHPERRLIADILRSVVGKYQTSWTQKIETTRDDEAVVDELLGWLLEVGQAGCMHTTTPGYRMFFRIETDASKYGMGVVIRHRSDPQAPWSVLYMDATAWKRVQRNYHVNRLEAYAMLIGLRVLGLFLDFVREANLGKGEVPTEVEVHSDSTTALAWARTGEPQVGYKSIEMRQILALAESLHLELRNLRGKAGVVLHHIQGDLNRDGDRLSRLLYRPLGNRCLGDFVQVPKKQAAADEKICKVEEKQSFLSLLAEESRDLPELLDRVHRWSLAFSSWGGRAGPEPSTEGGLQGGMWELGKMSQALFRPRKDHMYTMINGVYVVEQTLFNGEVVRRIVIPNQKELVRVRELICRFYHGQNQHRGVKFDVANLTTSTFHLEGVFRAVQSIIAKCWTCARKNAILRKALCQPVQTVPRVITFPPFSRISIDFVHFRATTVLSVLCTDTGVLFLSVVSAASAEGAIQGLRRLSHLYCVQIRRVMSDNARALSKSFQVEARKLWGDCQFVTRAAYESSQNPVERAHRDMWSILRSRKSTKSLSEDIQDITNEVLEEVMCIVNRRPLGTQGDTVVTPARLAWGANQIGPGGERLENFRRFFYENLFALNRRRHLPNRRLRRAFVPVGDMVLFQHGTREAKDQFEHRVGRVIAIEGNIITVQSQGKEVKVGSASVIPLSRYFQVERETGTSPGGHVE